MTHTCPICAKPFRLDDICASDITEGTCHAECLKGSAVVDLDTGDDLPSGKIATYPYTDVMDPTPQAKVSGTEPSLDWSNFEGPKRNVEWKPDDQDLIYTAINYCDDEFGDADEDVGQQLVERLLAAWLRSVNERGQW